MFTECKKHFNDNEFICSFINKAESAYQNNDYPSAITAMKNACRVFLEQSSDYYGAEFAALCECCDKIEAEFAHNKQKIVQETGYKTASKIDTLIGTIDYYGLPCHLWNDGTKLYITLNGCLSMEVWDKAIRYGFKELRFGSLYKELENFTYHTHNGQRYILSNEGVSFGSPECFEVMDK